MCFGAHIVSWGVRWIWKTMVVIKSIDLSVHELVTIMIYILIFEMMILEIKLKADSIESRNKGVRQIN